MIGLKRGIAKLVPYDKTWPDEFQKEKKKLEKLLGDNVVLIEHCGSTAIPGMKAKPLIDMLIGVKTIKREGKKCVKILDSLPGYYERPGYFPKIRFLVAKGNESRRTHYIHIVRYKGGIWNRSLAFRDYLRTHKKDAREYAELKTRLADVHADNRGVYTNKKTKFIKEVLMKADAVKR